VTKRTTFARLALVAGSLTISSVAFPGVSIGQGPREAAEVRAARAAQNAALTQHDLDRVASFWTDDIVIRSGLGRVIQSKTAYKNAFAGDSDLVYNREPDRVDVSNNNRWPLAFESGIWTARVNGSGPPIIRGRYAAQWIKRNGKWLIRSEVFVALTCSGQGCSRQIVAPER
jgi:ketosteroid isomerase-like protein